MGMNGRVLLAAAAALSAALVGAALVARTADPSPLARLPDGLAVARDVAYGPDPHQTLDIAYARSPSRPRPAILMIHPGGWMQGDKSAYHPRMAEFARLGYATVSVNFRPSGAATFPAAIDDCRLALRWLRARAAEFGIDPARIGATGWSSGAHLAMLLAVTDEGPDRLRAAVCVSGVYDFLLEARGRFPNAEDDEAVVRFLGAPPRRIPDVARRASPLRHLSADDPALFVVHGELDRRIDVEQARGFETASRALGRKDEVLVLPDGDHGRDVFPSAARDPIRGFFDRHLRPGE